MYHQLITDLQSLGSTGLKISWGGSEHAMYADGSILVPTSLKDELDVLLSEYGEMVSKNVPSVDN